MKTTIVIDDNDAADSPARPWTANLIDENGDTLCDPGFGLSRREALLDLIDIADHQFPGFDAPLLPQISDEGAKILEAARGLIDPSSGTGEYRRAILDMVSTTLIIPGVHDDDGDTKRALIEKWLDA